MSHHKPTDSTRQGLQGTLASGAIHGQRFDKPFGPASRDALARPGPTGLVGDDCEVANSGKASIIDCGAFGCAPEVNAAGNIKPLATA